MPIIRIYNVQRQLQEFSVLPGIWHKVRICWLPHVEQPLVVFKTAFSHFLVTEFKRFYAIFLEIENKLSFKEIGSRRLIHDLLESFTSQKHFIAVMPGHFDHSVLLAKIAYIGKTVPVKAYDALIPFLSASDLF
jgi:hypothetical protein